MAADALAAAGLFAAISLVRFGSGWIGAWDRSGIPAAVAMALWAAVWVLVLWFHGLYRLRAHWSAKTDVAQVVRATFLVGILIFVLLFAAKLPHVSRLFLVEMLTAQLALGIASRLILRVLFGAARERGRSTRYVLVAGVSPSAEAFADLIEGHRELGLRVVGHLSDDPAPTTAQLRRPILGRYEDIGTVLHTRVVDELAICLPLSDWPLVEAMTRICAEEGKVVRIPMDSAAPVLAGAVVEQFSGLTIHTLVYGPDRIVGLVVKRALDLVGAAIALVALAPVVAAAAAAIRIADGGPVFFRQPRVGLHGRTFNVLKFRTMVTDAELRLDGLLDQNEISGPAFKLTNDPRISRVGRVLRRTSLDELPQLWNVIRGDMSLVGPRPPLPREVATYDVWHRRRLSMKPGITGLWQVSERRSSDFDRWVSVDLDYIDRWSLWLDLKIMARTLPAMLEGR